MQSEAQTMIVAAAIREAVARGIIQPQSRGEAEYLKNWDDWTAVVNAAFKQAGVDFISA